MTSPYHLKNIRTLLIEGFSAQELKTFCFDEPALRPVYDQLAANTGKAEMVQRLVEYADRKELFTLVLSWAQEQNPAKYHTYQPYRSKQAISSRDAPSVHKPTQNHQATTYHPCFISYSHQDEEFAHKLYTDLQNKGVRCWIAPKDLKIGDKIRPTIDQAIRRHDKLMVILSKRSIDSPWVEREVEAAFEQEHKRREVILFPIRLDEAVMNTEQAWAADIRRTRHIGDFSRWRDDEVYQKAIERLLRDLKID